MNVIITGASGLLGRAVVSEFQRNSWKVLGLAHTRVRDGVVAIDVTDINAVSSIVREFKPHALIHCAAERSVDLMQANPNAFQRLNVVVPGELAKLAAEVKAVYVFISTADVFYGNNPPYREIDLPNPLNEYALSKVKAERSVMSANSRSCILRIPVIYGGEQFIEESVVSSLINAIKCKGLTEVSNFEVRYPSHTSDVAAVIYQLVQRKLQDESLVNLIFHWCGLEPFTKYQMAVIIAETFGLSHDHLIPIGVRMGGTPRPQNCQLSCEKLEALGIRRHTRFLEGIQEYRKFVE